jgi:hypothetical protein
MESIAFLKDMGQFLGISDSSKGTRGMTFDYLSLFPYYASFIIYFSFLSPFSHLQPASCSTHGVFPYLYYFSKVFKNLYYLPFSTRNLLR